MHFVARSRERCISAWVLARTGCGDACEWPARSAPTHRSTDAPCHPRCARCRTATFSYVEQAATATSPQPLGPRSVLARGRTLHRGRRTRPRPHERHLRLGRYGRRLSPCRKHKGQSDARGNPRCHTAHGTGRRPTRVDAIDSRSDVSDREWFLRRDGGRCSTCSKRYGRRSTGSPVPRTSTRRRTGWSTDSAVRESWRSRRLAPSRNV